MRRVVKLGGSLLLRSDTPGLLRKWVAEQLADDQVNLLIGGGRIVDALRELDDMHRFDPVEMHWRCIGALRLTYELACEWFPEAQPIQTEAEFQAHVANQSRGLFLIAVNSFYTTQDANVLPLGWQTTSDSLGALLAKKLSSKNLTLLKACPIAFDLSIAEAAASGIVDDALLRASEGIDVHLRTLA